MLRTMPAILLASLFVFWVGQAHAFGPTKISPSADFFVFTDGVAAERLSLMGAVEYVGHANISDGSGGMSVLDTSLTADYSIFNLTYELSTFNWSGDGLLGVSAGDGDPWHNLHELTLQTRLVSKRLTEKWWCWANADVTAAYEKALPGGVGAGFDGGMGYNIWKGWLIGGTGKVIALNAATNKLFGEVEVGVVLSASQKTINETLRDFGFEDVGEGSGSIGYNIAFTGTERTYKLNSSSRVSPKGYVETVDARVGAYLEYSSNDSFYMSIGPEYHYERKFRTYTRSGEKLDTYMLSNAWAGYAEFEWTF